MTSLSAVSGGIPPVVKKIGILRANALGDFIVTLPAIHALRNTYPNAEIVLFGKPWHKDFLEATERGRRRTPVDRVEILPVLKGLRDETGTEDPPGKVNEFFTRMQEEKFDVLLSFQGKGIAAIPFLKRIGAGFICGMTCEESEKPDAGFDFYYYQPEIARYLDIASLAGAAAVALDPHIEPLGKDCTEAEVFLKRHALQKYIAIHACGTDVRRMWSKEKFVEVCKVLSADGFEIVLTGSKEDRSYNQDIIGLSSAQVVNAAGELTLGAVAVLYRRSQVVISIDTGPLHLAIAAGAKTVGLYWAPNVINWAPLTRKRHRPAINWNMVCPHCGITPNDPFPFEPSSDCQHPTSFVDGITVHQVISNVRELLINS